MNRRVLVAAILICAVMAILTAGWLRERSIRWHRSDQGVTNSSRASKSSARRRQGEPELEAESDTPSRADSPTSLGARIEDHGREIQGIVLDPDSSPVVGTQIEVFRNRALELNATDTGLQHEERTAGRVLSDERGRFSIAVEPGRPHKLYARSDGYARALLPECYGGEDLVIHLQPAGVIFGRVTRTMDGSPISGARVIGWACDKGFVEVDRSVTDGLGTYRISELEQGRYRILIVPAIETPVRLGEFIELGPGESIERNVEIPPGVHVSGRVVDAATGKAIEEADVHGSWTFQQVVRTNADGLYALPGFGGEGDAFVYVQASGYPEDQRFIKLAKEGDIVVDFELNSGNVASGRVIDSRGYPIADACVEVVGNRRPTRSNQAGLFEIRWTDGADASFPRFLRIRKEGLGPAIRRMTTEEWKQPSVDLGDIVLPVAHLLSGLVVDEKGVLISDAAIILEESEPGRVSGATRSMETNPWGVRSAATNPVGGFHFCDLNSGTYRLMAGRPGGGDHFEESIQVTDHDETVRIVLPVGLALDGMVVDPNGYPLSNVEVRLWSESAEAQIIQPVRTRSDGVFRFRALKEGTYRLQAQLHSEPQGSLSFPNGLCNTERRTGLLAGSSNIQITFVEPIVTEGSVLTPDGMPSPHALVAALDSDGRVDSTTTADDMGHFALRLHPGAQVRLTAVAEADTSLSSSPVDIQAGARDVLLKVPRSP